ncbi:MAG: hypothetical protein M3Q48_02305 [Actinomycetota bacterium]|nr:hypothetical protein [Actinomycetota bacterium]
MSRLRRHVVAAGSGGAGEGAGDDAIVEAGGQAADECALRHVVAADAEAPELLAHREPDLVGVHRLGLVTVRLPHRRKLLDHRGRQGEERGCLAVDGHAEAAQIRHRRLGLFAQRPGDQSGAAVQEAVRVERLSGPAGGDKGAGVTGLGQLPKYHEALDPPTHDQDVDGDLDGHGGRR